MPDGSTAGRLFDEAFGKTVKRRGGKERAIAAEAGRWRGTLAIDDWLETSWRRHKHGLGERVRVAHAESCLHEQHD